MPKITFQWFFDIKTVKDSMQIITVSAGGELVRKRLYPFFASYKYFKLGSVKLKMVPSNTLPVDPLNLGYEGEDLVDPRDQVNPGLTRITNGEDVLEDLTGLSADEQRAIYYNMMLDTRWYKFNQQRGLTRSAYPKYWMIGQFHQDYYPGATINLPTVTSNKPTATLTSTLVANGSLQPPFDGTLSTGSNPRGLFQTGHTGRLGWLPTDGLAKISDASAAGRVDAPILAAIPEIEVYKIITPPQYRTLYYFRCYVSETVYFKGPIVNNAVPAIIDGNTKYYRSLDVFHAPTGQPIKPTYGYYGTTYEFQPTPPNDGGTSGGDGHR